MFLGMLKISVRFTRILGAVDTDLFVHVFPYIWGFCFPDFDTADMQRIHYRLHFRNVISRRRGESEHPEVGMMSGDVGQYRGIRIIPRRFVRFICSSAE